MRKATQLVFSRIIPCVLGLCALFAQRARADVKLPSVTGLRINPGIGPGSQFSLAGATRPTAYRNRLNKEWP